MLRELGDMAGGIDDSAISEAIGHFERKRLQHPAVRRGRNAFFKSRIWRRSGCKTQDTGR